MNHQVEKRETYREQLGRLAHALAAARHGDVLEDLVSPAAIARVKLFTDDNAGKRSEKLERQVAFVRPAFEMLDDLLDAFIRAQPMAAYDTGASDGDRFLEWLEQTQTLSAEQRDYVACQRARHAVEELARRNRSGYLRFQELLSAADVLAEELETNRSLRAYLNPIRVRAQFETPVLLGGQASVPVDVLFYPVAGDIRTAVLERKGEERLRELAAFGPSTLDEWLEGLEPFHCSAGLGRLELAALCRDLSAVGLVAFA